MSSLLITVEVQPGVHLRLRREEATRFGYVEVIAEHKAVKPTAKKTKAAPAPATSPAEVDALPVEDA